MARTDAAASTLPDESGRDVPDYDPTILESMLGDRSRVKILSYLCQHPDEVFLQTEISDGVGVSQAMVSRELKTLRENGIVVEGDYTGRNRNTGDTLAETGATALLRVMVDCDDGT